MDTQEALDEIQVIERIMDIRRYRFRKDMHDLDRDLEELKEKVREETKETSKVVQEEKEKAKARAED